jgi:hypothetical protein
VSNGRESEEVGIDAKNVVYVSEGEVYMTVVV